MSEDVEPLSEEALFLWLLRVRASTDAYDGWGTEMWEPRPQILPERRFLCIIDARDGEIARLREELESAVSAETEARERAEGAEAELDAERALREAAEAVCELIATPWEYHQIDWERLNAALDAWRALAHPEPVAGREEGDGE